MNWQNGLLWGKVVEEFTFQNLRQIAMKMAENWIPRRNQAATIIGYDTRFQADQAAIICAEVLAANGSKIFLDKNPTPLGALYLAMQMREAFGIMITGGQRAIEYNGLRMMRVGGIDLEKKEWEGWKKDLTSEAEVAKYQFAQLISSGTVSFQPILDLYIEFIRSTIDCKKLRESGIRVIFDPLYGSAQGVAKQLLQNENMEEIHDVKHSMFGGLVPILDHSNIQKLHSELTQKKKHLGILYDPEGYEWVLVSAKRGSVKHGKSILPHIEKIAYRKNLDRIFPHWRKDGILCSLLFLERIVEG